MRTELKAKWEQVGKACRMTNEEKAKVHEETLADWFITVPPVKSQSVVIDWCRDALVKDKLWPINDKGNPIGYNSARKINDYTAYVWNFRSYLKRWYTADMVKLEKEIKTAEAETAEAETAEAESINAVVCLDYLSSLPVDSKVEKAVQKALETLRKAFITT